jgi:hypothetical protein
MAHNELAVFAEIPMLSTARLQLGQLDHLSRRRLATLISGWLNEDIFPEVVTFFQTYERKTFRFEFVCLEENSYLLFANFKNQLVLTDFSICPSFRG